MGPTLKRRLLGLAWLTLAMLWLPIEDTQVWLALVLGGTGCLWLGLAFWERVADRQGGWLARAVTGALIGLATPLAAGLLMVLKTGIHAHGFSDFSGAQMGSVLRLAPLLGLAGFLVGSIGVLTNKGKMNENGHKRGAE